MLNNFFVQPWVVFGPLFVMMALVCVVACLMLRERLRQLKDLQLSPQQVATRVQMRTAFEDTRCADNFQNLFEVPVLFYVVLLGLCMTQTYSMATEILAWLYVLLRIAHSAVHCGRNVVKTRFQLFALSHGTLVLLWVLWAVELM